MKTLIIYFSGTGNTWYVAKKMNTELNKVGVNSEMISIEHISTNFDSLIETFDHLIIGYPIYGSLAPRLMEDFIYNLPNLNKKISIFSTVAFASGDGCNYYKNIIEEKGYQFQNAFEFKMNNNFNVPGFPDVFRVGNQEKIDKRHKNVMSNIIEMAICIKNDTPKIYGDGFISKFLGNTQRKEINKHIKKLNNNLFVSNEHCVNCNKCVKICPTNNIMSKNKEIIIEGNCMACMRCYHQCPTQAINITEKSLDTNKWKRFRGVYQEFERDIMHKKKVINNR